MVAARRRCGLLDVVHEDAARELGLIEQRSILGPAINAGYRLPNDQAASTRSSRSAGTWVASDPFFISALSYMLQYTREPTRSASHG